MGTDTPVSAYATQGISPVCASWTVTIKGRTIRGDVPGQSGKNEIQEQLEEVLMAANQHRCGNIIKITQTEKNQWKVSMERQAGVLRTGVLGLVGRKSKE